MSTFSERLCQLRKETGQSQTDFAKEIGIPYRSYRRYEAGESSPTIPTLLLLADYFQVSTDYLVGRNDQRSRRIP